MAALTNTIPEKTIERLSEYRRTLLASHKQGITHIFSHVLAGIHGITAVQVRRDLMLIGFSSDTKKGYDVQVLIEYISKILDSPSQMNIAVLGMGHLGQAITKYFNGKGLKLKITAAFDVDPEKVGKTIDGIPCYHMDSFEEVVEDKDISIVIVSSPTNLFALLKLVADLWKYNDQDKNTKEIAACGLKLYEQLVAFTGSLEGVGTALDKARDAYEDAHKRLCTGNDNIVRVGERLRKTASLQTKKRHSARTLEIAGADQDPAALSATESATESAAETAAKSAAETAAKSAAEAAATDTTAQ